MRLRPYNSSTDHDGLRACVVALQEYECRIDPRMPPGEEIADDYLKDMEEQCDELDGTVIVADAEGEIAGYAMVLCRVSSGDVDDGDFEFGLLSDLMVLDRWRSRGLGQQLIEYAESVARCRGVQWLRINVLAANRAAVGLYESLGYKPYTVDFEKPLILHA